MGDIPLIKAMVCANSGKEWDSLGPRVKVFHYPDVHMLSSGYSWSIGACDMRWSRVDDAGRKLLLMIEAHHLAVFHDVPARLIHEALMVIPEYRDMLAEDCLPAEFAR